MVEMVLDPTVQGISRPENDSWPTRTAFEKHAHLLPDVMAQFACSGLVTLALVQLNPDRTQSSPDTWWIGHRAPE